MSFLKASRFLLPLSAIAMVASVVLFFYPGPVPSIEFTGGTLIELSMPQGTGDGDVHQSLISFDDTTANLQNAAILQTRAGTVLIRTQDLTNEQHLALLDHLKNDLGQIQELQYTTIGPTVGASLKARAVWALLAAAVAIVLYLALAFRNIPKSMSPWTFGLAAITALFHDIIITVGIFTVLSRFTDFQVDTLFITALLSIMGYSVNDTIIIFDRFRDNLQESGKKQDIGTLAELSLRQTLSRTFNTSLGALIMLFALMFIGAQSIRWFMLALIIGTVIGTYSSYFIATPLLVYWKKRAR